MPHEVELTLTGELGSDTTEGSCTYLQTADGTRYELLFRPGVPPATGGTVTVRGELMPDMASICMIGPIFLVTEVIANDR